MNRKTNPPKKGLSVHTGVYYRLNINIQQLLASIIFICHVILPSEVIKVHRRSKVERSTSECIFSHTYSYEPL